MTEQKENNRVVLGLSGGVDSTAAALLLREKGFEVTGLFFDVLGNQTAEAARAKRAATELGISFVYKNAKEVFADQVISYFCHSYEQGRTPNPCIFCNPTVKFQILKEEADRLGAYFVATGHYARVCKETSTDLYYLHQGENRKKDQSYMLYRLPQSILRRLILPLGMYESKDTVRQLVRENGVFNADTKDSQEICFIKEGSYIDYLQQYGCVSRPGDFVDMDGKRLGTHQGLIHYTIGQRKGLGITFGKPMFVVGLNPENNQVILGENEQLFTNSVEADGCRFSACEGDQQCMPQDYEGREVLAKIRYAAAPAVAVLSRVNDHTIRLTFQELQRAATPGQSLVFYDGDRLLGGGFIK